MTCLLKPALKEPYKDTLRPREPEAVMDVAKMREIRDWLKAQNKTYQEKRLLWCICTFLFMGSLRPSEILSHSGKEFDPNKCQNPWFLGKIELHMWRFGNMAYYNVFHSNLFSRTFTTMIQKRKMEKTS